MHIKKQVKEVCPKEPHIYVKYPEEANLEIESRVVAV